MNKRFALMFFLVAWVALLVISCEQATTLSNDSVVGTWVNVATINTTIVFKSDYTGTLSMGSGPTPFVWSKNGATYTATVGGSSAFTATYSGSSLMVSLLGATAFACTKQ